MSTIKSFQEYLQLEKNYSLHTVKAYIDDLNFFQKFIEINFDTVNIDDECRSVLIADKNG